MVGSDHRWEWARLNICVENRCYGKINLPSHRFGQIIDIEKVLFLWISIFKGQREDLRNPSFPLLIEISIHPCKIVHGKEVAQGHTLATLGTSWIPRVRSTTRIINVAIIINVILWVGYKKLKYNHWSPIGYGKDVVVYQSMLVYGIWGVLIGF